MRRSDAICVRLIKGRDSGAVGVIHYPSAVLLFDNDHFVLSSCHDLDTQRRSVTVRSGG